MVLCCPKWISFVLRSGTMRKLPPRSLDAFHRAARILNSAIGTPYADYADLGRH